jgi:hypothetical protein
MGYSVAAAAAAAGVSKTILLRAIQAGRISGTKNEINEWQDPTELHHLAEFRHLCAPNAGRSVATGSPRGTAPPTDPRAISGRAEAIHSRAQLNDIAQGKRLSGLAIPDQKAQQTARTRWWRQVTGS